MKVVDLNLLLYAVDRGSARHAGARQWLDRALNGSETVALPWEVLLGFVRLSTNRRVFRRALTAEEAMDVVQEWLSLPVVVALAPGRRHAAILRELLVDAGTAGNLVSDAHLAALAIEHGAELCSCDTDFARFQGLRWVDPLR